MNLLELTRLLEMLTSTLPAIIPTRQAFRYGLSIFQSPAPVAVQMDSFKKESELRNLYH